MSVDLGPVRVLGAEAVGQPGERRFRLFVQSTHSSAVMWLEKEQLNSLSLALDRSLALLTEGQVLRTEAQVGTPITPPGMPANFPKQPDYEFQVGQIKLSYDDQDSLFVLSAMPIEIIMERGEEPQVLINEVNSVAFLFTQLQAHDLSITITRVVAGGRPVCPLCKAPLDGGPHACVKQNGHREIIQLERDGSESEEE
jgi:uncharacterized repeat protein (TIGR03847 family)